MKFASLLLSLLALGLVPGAAAQTAKPSTPATAAPAPAPTVATTNLVTQPGYSFTAAGGWLSLRNDQGNSALKGPAVTGKPHANFTVLVSDLSKVAKANRTLGVARDVRAEELPTLVKNFKWLGERTVKVAPSGTLGVLWSYSGQDQGQGFRWTQLMTMKGDKLYTVTLAVPDGTRADVAAAGRTMFDSFALR